MKVHQIISHIKRNQDDLKVNVSEMADLLNHHDYMTEYLNPKQIHELFKEHYPEFNYKVNVWFSKIQQAMMDKYKRQVSYSELLNVHKWWNKLKKLGNRTFVRLDQYDPYGAACGQIEQEQLITIIGSIKAGIKNPLQRNHDLLIVVGTATGYDTQLKTIEEPHDTVAVNGAGLKVPCDFWYSIHGSYIKEQYGKTSWKPKTISEWWVEGIDSGYGIFNEELVQYNQFHYSGNMAAMVGLMMGYPRIIMVGCPLDSVRISHDLDEFEGDTWEHKLSHIMPKIQQDFVNGIALFPEFREKVRSISGGFTEHQLGRSW